MVNQTGKVTFLLLRQKLWGTKSYDSTTSKKTNANPHTQCLTVSLGGCRKHTLGTILLWEQICARLSPAASVFVISTNVDSWGDFLVMKSNLHNIELFIVSRQLRVVCVCVFYDTQCLLWVLAEFIFGPKTALLIHSYTHTKLIHRKQNPPIVIQQCKCIMSLF